MKYLLILVWVVCSFNTYSEVLPTFKLAQLSIFSNKIVEAKFIKEVDGDFFFLTRDIKDLSDFSDTLITDGLASFDYMKDSESEFKVTDKFIIYLARQEETYNGKSKLVPMLSGVRMFRKDQIFLPTQMDNPGGYHFIGSSDRMSWEELKENVIKVEARVSYVKSLKSINDPSNRNKILLNWIEENKNSFWEEDCGWNSDCGWGSFAWEMFDWITESNIAKDTWQAFLLFVELSANSKQDWRTDNVQLQDKNGSSFKTYQDIEFLIEIASNSKAAMNHRKQALNYLSQAVRKVYEDNYPIPDSTRLSFQQQKQKEIRDIIFTLMDDPALKQAAFDVVSGLSNPRDGNLKHRVDLELLPAIIEIYQKELFSKFKTSLGEFIVFNVSEEVWKSISGNDAKIFIEVSKYMHVDTVKKYFSLYPSIQFRKADYSGITQSCFSI